MSRNRLLSLFAACLSCIWPALHAQDLELALEPAAATIRTCDELVVDVRLRNPGSRVGGYQLFVRYSAEHFEPLRFEPGAIDASVFTSGPSPFGGGLEPCVTGIGDPWDDGSGEDVLAVAATVTRSADGGENDPVLGAGEALLGRIHFRPRSGPASADDARFSLNDESCWPPFDQSTRVFSETGEDLSATLVGSFGVEVIDGGPPLENLRCEQTAAEEVTISWDPPAGGGVSEVEILRDGASWATLASDQVTFVDGGVAAPATVVYEVVWVLAAGGDACGRQSCQVDTLVYFRRGDIDTDGRFNITDPVKLLRFLFAGESIDCEDAGDHDDDGALIISDAILLLTYLFQDGAEPASPFPQPGPDPTPEDGLGCERYAPQEI